MLQNRLLQIIYFGQILSIISILNNLINNKMNYYKLYYIKLTFSQINLPLFTFIKKGKLLHSYGTGGNDVNNEQSITN